jgi:hypothetical protein
MRTGLVVVLAVVAGLNVGVAQVPAGPGLQLEVAAKPVPMERLFLGGVAGLGAAILGTHLAYQAGGGGRICGDDSCGLAAGITALLLLEPILVPAGVHLANHRRGSFAGTFFGSLLSGTVALYVGNKLDLGVEFVYVGAALQIATSAIIERAGERERQRK